MTAYQLIEGHIRYNQWANQRIIAWLRSQSDFLMLESTQSGFGSLNKVLHHLMEATTYYYSILSDRKVHYYKELDTNEIFLQLISVDQKLLDWYLDQESEIVNHVISLKRSPHEEKYDVATLITHIVNHGTYHRGQLVDLRHQLSISEPPKTDYYWMTAEKLLTDAKPNRLT